jgi:hypothetical protein
MVPLHSKALCPTIHPNAPVEHEFRPATKKTTATRPTGPILPSPLHFLRLHLVILTLTSISTNYHTWRSLLRRRGPIWPQTQLHKPLLPPFQHFIHLCHPINLIKLLLRLNPRLFQRLIRSFAETPKNNKSFSFSVRFFEFFLA